MTEDRALLDEAIASVEEQLSVLFSRARTLWRDGAAAIHPDLQPVGYKILGSIVRMKQTNAHRLAELLEVDKSVVSRQVRVLEELGLVLSTADATDGRARVLSPTPQAIAKVDSLRLVTQERLRTALSVYSPEQLRSFAEILSSLSVV